MKLLFAMLGTAVLSLGGTLIFALLNLFARFASLLNGVT